jgi:hypothetical protein
MFKSKSQFIPVLVGIFALLGASSSIQFMFVQSAGADGQQQSGTQAQSTETDSEIVVPPWCHLFMDVPEVITFNPIDSNGSEISDFIYSGAEQTFRSDTLNESYYISGQNGLTEQAGSENCSWFGETGSGDAISFSLSRLEFQAYGQDPDTGVFDNRVTSMDFEFDDTNPLNLNRAFGSICATTDFETSTSQVAISSAGMDFPLVSLNADKVTTNNFCTAETKYSLNLPANLIPDISNTRYKWDGPTITFTAVMSNDQLARYLFWVPQEQSISFTQPEAMSVNQVGQALQATATSGLDVSFTSNTSSICTIESGQVLPQGAGICSITASQSGQTPDYKAAVPLTREFTIIKEDPSVITFNIPSTVKTNTTSSQFSVTTNSSGSVTWSISSSSSVCSIQNASAAKAQIGRNNRIPDCTLKLEIAETTTYNSYTQEWTVRTP